MFSDKCKYACGLRGAHPICFGFFINYDVLSSEHGNKNPKKEPETQVCTYFFDMASKAQYFMAQR